MLRKFIPIATVAFVLVAAAPAARACDDNSDTVVAKLQNLKLSTDQMKTIFAFQKEHRDFIQKSHRDGSGCLAHERHDLVFEKQAVGVLSDDQFKKYEGRERNETESLRYQNYLLKVEIERLKKELEEIKADAKPAKKEEKKEGTDKKSA